MNFAQEIERLKSFNQTVDILQGFNFWKKFPKKSGVNIKLDYTKEIVEINSKIVGPDDEAISAFILKYRLFIQSKDDISLRKIDKLYSTLPIEKEYYEKFKDKRKSFNNNLDQPANVTMKNHTVTKRKSMLCLFMELGHILMKKTIIESVFNLLRIIQFCIQ